MDGVGYIYILESSSSVHIKKIGYTRRHPDIRLKEWQISCPSMEFRLRSWFKCTHVKETERLTHWILATRKLRTHTCADCKRRHRELFVLPETNDTGLTVALLANLSLLN
ncbi:hypothetical protein K435DRAFT_870747 [Dendrothele bispora CBS 962.96]|uniref:Bacteriophage T5 Orf172 DNA-binding domain-containing protein n=1 Tax=Dendrothele bispora (strain CBS 962.96) TaxID=1314807 RepID=A0A4S8L776_DENBC|nr:hypothetical protein K435DRAFT_870747 [Dendrothele bispora CBS 962.96]